MKRFIYLIVVVGAFLFTTPLFAVQTWDGTSSEMWTQGTGTEADPYLIETPANLAYLSAQVTAGETYAGVYFQQTEDFDLQSKTWTPIGTSTYKFAGIYDGGNKFISNLTNSIFGSVNNSTIQNITLRGVDYAFNENYPSSFPQKIAFLVLDAFGDTNIKNCHNSINIQIDAGIVSVGNQLICYYGGLVANGNESSLIIENCSNIGDINVRLSTQGYYEACYVRIYGGGIVGYAENSRFLRCFNKGNLDIYYFHSGSHSCNVDNYQCVSGIAGADTESGNVYEQCFSKGSINGHGAYQYGIGRGKLQKGCYVIGDFQVNTGKSTNAFGANEIESCYYIYSSSSSFLSSASMPINCLNVYHNISSQSGTYRSEESMKSPAMISLLNSLDDYFTMDLEGINDGYPILKWQAGPRFTITGSCDANRGTVKGGGEYAPGNTVTLTATPKKGCTFVGWSDGNTDNPRTITVEGDANYIAQFTKSAYTIYVNQDGTSYIE